MSKEQLLQEYADAFEQLIGTASLAAQRGVTRQKDMWGPREIVAHLAGWEVMASRRISLIAAGKPPFEFHETPQIADAINAIIVTMIGDQTLDALIGILRQAYQRNIELLKMVDNTRFRSGEYVYERTKAVIEHCQEHMEPFILPHS